MTAHETTLVLVVDDEPEFRSNMIRLLAAAGVLAEAAADGEEALERLATGRYDVALLDVRMPGMDGVEVVRRIRDKGLDVDAILLTGHASIDDAVQAMNLGAADYLLKPVRTSTVAGKIAEVRGRRRERLGEQPEPEREEA
ncbi:MAG: response regulator [Desulfovibrionaceae bacterium]